MTPQQAEVPDQAMTRAIIAWARRNMPRRETLEHNRYIGFLARRHELWRFTRRSVPRGVAVGLLVGIFALIPGIQIAGAALLCLPLRGNIPLAALMTFLSNPATTPFILAASLMVGNALGFHADLAAFEALYQGGAGFGEWTDWFLSDAAPAVLLGLSIIATLSAVLGYGIAFVAWRLIVSRRRHARRVERAARSAQLR